MSEYIRICPVCGDGRLRRLPQGLSLCPACTHVFQSDLRLGADYAEKRADNGPVRAGNSLGGGLGGAAGGGFGARAGGIPTALNGRDRLAALRADFILKHLDLPEGGRILNLGGASGGFAGAMSRAGFRAGDLGEKDADSGASYDLLTFFNALEGLADLEEPLALRGAAYAAVSVPARPEFFPDRPLAWPWFKPGRHLHYFSERSLDAYMRRFGMIRVGWGWPEDLVRGRLFTDCGLISNTYTAIYARTDLSVTRAPFGPRPVKTVFRGAVNF